MTARAVLDFIGFPLSAPEHLECRLRRVTYRPDGSVLDDGSRTSQKQTGCHRFILSPRQDIEEVVAQSFDRLIEVPVVPSRLERFLRWARLLPRRETWYRIVRQTGMLSQEGYGRPDTSLMHVVADYTSAHPKSYAVTALTHQLVLRALGFDLVGEGQLAVGLGKATLTPDRAEVTQKAGVVLHAGDDLEAFVTAVHGYAIAHGYQPLGSEDVGLLRHVAGHLWTEERVSHRRRQLSAMADACRIDRRAYAVLELEHRVMAGVEKWEPTGVKLDA